MVDSFDIDLDASLIAYSDGEPVGLANLGDQSRRSVDRRHRRRSGGAASGNRRDRHARGPRRGARTRCCKRLARGNRAERERVPALREARVRVGAPRRGLDSSPRIPRAGPRARCRLPRHTCAYASCARHASRGSARTRRLRTTTTRAGSRPAPALPSSRSPRGFSCADRRLARARSRPPRRGRSAAVVALNFPVDDPRCGRVARARRHAFRTPARDGAPAVAG